MARIGLLGGTFDPPHMAHLVVAECARVTLDLDEVWFLVAGDPWMKDVGTPADVRVELTRLAVAGAEGFVVDDRETLQPGPTYTFDTLTSLRAERVGVDWFFLLGADQVATLGAWHRVSELVELATFVAVCRPGQELDLSGPVRSRLEVLEVPLLEISSTDLRRRYRAGEATRFLVPPVVDDAIRARGLYRT